MATIASQITSLTVVYSIVYSGADQRKHQSSASLAFVWGIHRGPVNSPHKGPVTRKMFPFDDVIMLGWVSVDKVRTIKTWLRNHCMEVTLYFPMIDQHRICYHKECEIITDFNYINIIYLCLIIICAHDDVIKWKPFPRYWPFVRGIHRSPVNSPHKGQWHATLTFSLICDRING